MVTNCRPYEDESFTQSHSNLKYCDENESGTENLDFNKSSFK